MTSILTKTIVVVISGIIEAALLRGPGTLCSSGREDSIKKHMYCMSIHVLHALKLSVQRQTVKHAFPHLLFIHH